QLKTAFPSRPLEQAKQSLRCHWQLEDGGAKRLERVGQRVRDRRWRTNSTAFAHAPKTASCGWGFDLKMPGTDRGHITCPGERVIDQTCREDLTRLVIHDLFVERGSDALSYRAMHLAVDD